MNQDQTARASSSDNNEGEDWQPEREVHLYCGLVTVKSLHQLEEMKLVEDLQKEIWGYGLPGKAFPYPARCLFEFVESGGLVAAALLNGTPISFSCAWLGRDKTSSKYYLHSQLVGVLEMYRSSGLGFVMKTFQRDYAIYGNLDLIKWTFDPLITRNANLNLRKLGAVVRRYVPDYYGHLASAFNKGLATDRFWAEWYLNSARVKRRLAIGIPFAEPTSIDEDFTFVTRVEPDPSGLGHLIEYTLNLEAPRLLVEVPEDIGKVLQQDRQLALDWQNKIRAIFLHYLEQGAYIISDLFVNVDGSNRRTSYLLNKKPLPEILST